jgi:hypothetical protein
MKEERKNEREEGKARGREGGRERERKRGRLHLLPVQQAHIVGDASLRHDLVKERGREEIGGVEGGGEGEREGGREEGRA